MTPQDPDCYRPSVLETFGSGRAHLGIQTGLLVHWNFQANAPVCETLMAVRQAGLTSPKSLISLIIKVFGSYSAALNGYYNSEFPLFF